MTVWDYGEAGVPPMPTPRAAHPQREGAYEGKAHLKDRIAWLERERKILTSERDRAVAMLKVAETRLGRIDRAKAKAKARMKGRTK